jgi:hypothetical protein
MDDNSLKVLSVLYDNPDKEFSTHEFYEFVKAEIGWHDYLKIVDRFHEQEFTDPNVSGLKITQIGISKYQKVTNEKEPKVFAELQKPPTLNKLLESAAISNERQRKRLNEKSEEVNHLKELANKREDPMKGVNLNISKELFWTIATAAVGLSFFLGTLKSDKDKVDYYSENKELHRQVDEMTFAMVEKDSKLQALGRQFFLKDSTIKVLSERLHLDSIKILKAK